MKRIFFTILVLTAALSLLACATGRYVENTTTEVHNHAPGIWPDWYIPERNFGGVSFRISARTGYADSECVVADKESEYILDKALMLRNARVEDRYNVLVTCKEHPATAFVHRDYVSESCKANADLFDLAMTNVCESSPLITSGMVYNWAKLPYTKLIESHWMYGMNKNFAVRDAIYIAISKMCVSAIDQTAVLVYNRDLGEEWAHGKEFTTNIFESIRYGEWTYDYIMQIVNEYQWKDAGDDGRTADDGYALYMTADRDIDAWHTAWEIPIINNSDENGLEDVYMSSKLLTFADRMRDMYCNTPGVFYGSHSETIDAVKSGRALFAVSSLSDVINNSADMDYCYSVLPMPKFEGSQKNYRSPMFDDYSVMSIPISADPESVSLIVEALSISSEDNVYSVYRVEALRGLYLTDTDSYEMLDIVLNNVSWDIAKTLGERLPADMTSVVRLDIMNNPTSSQLSQTYNDMKNAIADAIADIMEEVDAFRNN